MLADGNYSVEPWKSGRWASSPQRSRPVESVSPLSHETRRQDHPTTGQPSVIPSREVLLRRRRSNRIGPTPWVACLLPAPVLMGVEEGYFVGCSAAIEGNTQEVRTTARPNSYWWTRQPRINPESGSPGDRRAGWQAGRFSQKAKLFLLWVGVVAVSYIGRKSNPHARRCRGDGLRDDLEARQPWDRFGHRTGVNVPASRSRKAESLGSLLPEIPGLSREGTACGS